MISMNITNDLIVIINMVITTSMNLAISIRHCSQTYCQKPNTTQNHHLGDMAIPPLYLERDKCRCTMTDA